MSDTANIERSSDRLIKRWGAFLAAMIAAGAILSFLGNAMWVRISAYETDRQAQFSVNQRALEAQASAHESTAIVAVKLDALKQQVEASTTASAVRQSEIKVQLDELLRRKGH